MHSITLKFKNNINLPFFLLFHALFIMNRIHEQRRNNIIALANEGLSSREIESRLHVGRTTVSRIRSEIDMSVKKRCGGCPKKLTAADKRKLARTITSGQADTAAQVKRAINDTCDINISVDTVRRALKEVGLKSGVKPKKPLLQPRHIKCRYEFALKHQYWTVDDWKRVVWSDETKINRFGSDGRQWVWKRPGGALTAQHIQGTVKFGGGCIMVWGCMTTHGVGKLCRIDGHMNAQRYTQILDFELVGSVEQQGLDKGDIVFQQDNDPKHTSRMARNWFENNGVEVLDWPAQSPDLNPIEHLWHYLKRQLANYEEDASSMHELWQRVKAEWSKIPVQTCMELIDSMPRRIAAVLKAKGGYTKY